ncbi:MAG: cupin domain-containing protein [Syntrophorhabdaceae bacterium]|nr:cupin domain-containing protein [Syntrophorhabdaceae bacterium]MDD5242704.1 cupin domain-containing protein [Syntrophorhabdaceae bacterium]
MDKVIIERLPETREIDGVKRWNEERGEFAQISYREDIGHVAIFELKKGLYRGSHFHKEKEEVFYVVSGKIRAIFMDIDTKEREEHILEKGHKIRVETGVAHIFYGLDDALVVEYSPQYYDKRDAYPVDFYKK